MSRHIITTHDTSPFICNNCELTVMPQRSGTKHRNHCPHCLWSRHVDMATGDRRCSCRGNMEPIGIWVKKRQEWSIIHRCKKCGFIRTNRIAGDDNETLLLSLAARPMTQLPFPADRALKQIEKISIFGEKL